MPFQSEKQRKYLHANHPEIAVRWEKITKKVDLSVLQLQEDVVK